LVNIMEVLKSGSAEWSADVYKMDGPITFEDAQVGVVVAITEEKVIIHVTDDDYAAIQNITEYDRLSDHPDVE
jgi:hypothetical protein